MDGKMDVGVRLVDENRGVRCRRLLRCLCPEVPRGAWLPRVGGRGLGVCGKLGI